MVNLEVVLPEGIEPSSFANQAIMVYKATALPLCYGSKGTALDLGITGLGHSPSDSQQCLAPLDGFEPPTSALTVRRSTTELQRNRSTPGLPVHRGSSVLCFPYRCFGPLSYPSIV